MKFQIIHSSGIDEFQMKVQAELEKGWQLLGSPLTARVHERLDMARAGGVPIPEQLLQAMVRPD
jgi:hypothetical protein